ncbi:MAG: M48 family metallopeptidase [Clostridiales bacterium]|nr:M48 family metallopeptidase [Clostridiales bacterium]
MIKYEYTLIRSARRSVSVTIKEDNTLIVHASKKMIVGEIERFLLSKSKCIDAHLNQNAAKNSELADIIDYKKILVAGIPVKFAVGENNAFMPDGVCVKSFKNLKKLFCDNLGGQFLSIFEEVRRQNCFKCGEISFKDYKAKWGCCDRAGNITFNYKLLMLPQNLWRYVIAHELCHTVYMDHSKSFYSLLERVLPTYKSERKQLKSYSRITRLY